MAAVLMVGNPLHVFAAEDDLDGNQPVISYSENTGNIFVGDTEGISQVTGSGYTPLDVAENQDENYYYVEKVFEIPADFDPMDLVENDFEKNGLTFSFHELTRTRKLPDEVVTDFGSKTITIHSSTNNKSDYMLQLPNVVVYDENGFLGQLPLIEGTITCEPGGYTSYSYTVTDYREHSGMDRDDPHYIPKSITKDGVELTLRDIDWQPMGGLNSTNPLYSARAEYAGIATGSKATGYVVSAIYQGQVEKSIPGNVLYTVVYSAQPITAISGLDFDSTTQNSDEEEKAKKRGVSPFAVIGGVIMLGVIGTGAFIFIKKRHIPVTELTYEDPDNPTQGEQETMKVYVKRGEEG